MMDFFESGCVTAGITARRFGLCDEGHQRPAYVDLANEERWIGVVNNSRGQELRFVAVDNCVEMRREDGKMGRRCDCVLEGAGVLVFVELKERKSNSLAVKEAVLQLRATIEAFRATGDFGYERVEAYVCNRKHPVVNVMHMERATRFHDETGVRLFLQQMIDI